MSKRSAERRKHPTMHAREIKGKKRNELHESF